MNGVYPSSKRYKLTTNVSIESLYNLKLLLIFYKLPLHRSSCDGCGNGRAYDDGLNAH